MLITDIYDKVGKDGQENEAAYKKLPKVLQYFISSQQNLLISRIIAQVKRRYGDAGVESLIKTSGFRAHSVNARYGGVIDSLHLFGCAADFSKFGLFKVVHPPICDQLQVIDSGDCWHIQFKRG